MRTPPLAFEATSSAYLGLGSFRGVTGPEFLAFGSKARYHEFVEPSRVVPSGGTPDEKLSSLHDFGEHHDGDFPGGLTSIENRLYGTTADGGDYGAGTVFALSP
jgi:uncharacterized repeat protein (TIGR03803 family)